MSENSTYLAYATANDPLGYFLDAQNFQRMRKFDSGVDRVDISIAVSEVEPRSQKDQSWYDRLAQGLEKTGRFRVMALFFKPNLGRDFSSWFSAVDRLPDRRDDDFILMLNRSGYGPLQDNWYARFMKPFAENSALGICGASINFEHNVHVQTYAWMTRAKVLSAISGEYPGKHAVTRETAIFNGELALSRRVMAKGYQITSLAWPGEIFDESRDADPSLPQYNISANLAGVPYRHLERADILRARQSPYLKLARKFDWLSL